MTPTQAIADLDRELAAFGEDVTLRPPGGAPFTVRGQVVGYRPEEIIPGSIVQAGDRRVTISPTGVPAGLTINPQFKAVIGGVERQVRAAPAVRLAGQVVRYNLVVAG